MLSIIIPTYNERDNVFQISKRIKDILNAHDYEIIFVDDSNDDTPTILQALTKIDQNVRYEHRMNERGLGTAVVRGFELAGGDTITVMDADLQHPPEMLLPMLSAIHSDCDIVIPSRFIPGGDDGGLNLVRKLISAIARYMGKLMLKRVRSINDPTSGFFMFKKEIIKDVELKPIGWKILIEILVKGNYSNIIEIPYQFHVRTSGESKMSLKEQWNYISHLVTLVKISPPDRRFFLFAMVGVTGVVVNMIFYNMLIRWLHMDVVVSGILSACIAMLSNFFLNDQHTWSDIQHKDALSKRTLKFIMTSVIGIGISTIVLSLAYNVLGIQFIAANLIGIACGTIWNFSINNIWTFKSRRVLLPKLKIIQWSSDKMEAQRQ